MKKLLPFLILIIAAALTVVLIAFKPEPKAASPERPLTSVEFLTAQPETTSIWIHSQGSLLPRIETDLTVEVSGRIIEMGEKFQVGAAFEVGDILLRIDPADYQTALATRRAELAGAKLALAQEKALAQQAAADWRAMGTGEPSPLTLRIPQLEQAEAQAQSAEAVLAKAQRDLDRTAVKAPYAGRVLTKNVDIAQFISGPPSQPIGRIFATHSGEIRLPITQREATLLDYQAGTQRAVQLRLSDVDSSARWTARIDRIEATIDPQSRLLYVVAQIDAPFEAAPSDSRPTLRRGIFLQAEIEGRAVENAYALPRYALRGSNTVYVLTPDNRLQTRQVSILQSDPQRVIIKSGLQPGERVATSPIAYYVENMPVNPIANP
ncbi:MAG: RND family efflux transporter MFP subunit [Lentimonas sp.]|jgi:RND family efflux transporter MFP subunit